jgi:hypothetical protein
LRITVGGKQQSDQREVAKGTDASVGTSVFEMQEQLETSTLNQEKLREVLSRKQQPSRVWDRAPIRQVNFNPQIQIQLFKGDSVEQLPISQASPSPLHSQPLRQAQLEAAPPL